MMGKILNALLVVFALTFVLTIPRNTAFAGSNSSGSLGGLTWFTSSYSIPYFYYNGNAWSYTIGTSSTYYIYVSATTYNNCDYEHQISNAWKQAWNSGSVTAVAIAGSSQCGTMTWMRVNGQHSLQPFPGGPWTRFNTTELKNVPPY
jgi:hypothetical protein